MVMLKTMLRVVAIAMLLQLAMAKAKTYAVGGPYGGWRTENNLQSWANSCKFFVGDSLSFEYTEGNEVVQVWKEGYDTCNSTNPILISATGDTTVTLTSPGVNYFIAGIPGECLDGMKVAVTVLSSASPSPSPSPSPPPTSSVSSPPTASPASRITPHPPCKSPATNPPRKHHYRPFTRVHYIGSPIIAPSPGPSGAMQSSSTDKINFVVRFTMGFGFIIMMVYSTYFLI